MPKPKKEDLKPCSIFVKVRPQASSGVTTDHDVDGEAVEKGIESFDAESVTLGTQLMLSKESTKYSYMKGVVLPEADQESAYDTMIPALIENFVEGKAHSLFFAYGQSGTGKTHTMFGPNFEESLKIPEGGGLDPEWGVFPRVAHNALEQMKATGRKFTLTASAVEFYLMGVFDLLDNKNMLLPDVYFEHKTYGEKVVPITSIEDLVQFLSTAYTARTVATTKLNAGSSRSHCALTLTLNQLDEGDEKVTMTKFTLVDLAGAERLSKTGALDGGVAPQEELFKILMGEEPKSLAVTGLIINMELMEIGKEAIKATDAHKKGRKYVPPKQLATSAMQFVGSNFDATVDVGMVVCLSQAPQNGWETWFSLEFGKNLSELKVVLKKPKSVTLSKSLKEAKEKVKSCQAALDKTPKEGPSAKYRPRRTADVKVWEARAFALEQVQSLL